MRPVRLGIRSSLESALCCECLPVLLIALIVGVLDLAPEGAAKRPESKSPDEAPFAPPLDWTEQRCAACDTLHCFQVVGVGDEHTRLNCGERVVICLLAAVLR